MQKLPSKNIRVFCNFFLSVVNDLLQKCGFGLDTIFKNIFLNTINFYSNLILGKFPTKSILLITWLIN